MESLLDILPVEKGVRFVLVAKLNAIKSFISRRRNSLSIILLYNGVLVFFSILFYYLTTYLFNEAPGFSVISNGIATLVQYTITVGLALTAGDICFIRVLKGIDNLESLKAQDGDNEYIINQIRKKCFNLPYTIYVVQLIIPFICIFLVAGLTVFLNDISSVAYLIRFVLAVTSFAALISVISLIFSKGIFRKILLDTFQGYKMEGVRIKLRDKIFLQIIPMFIVAAIFTSLTGYSRVIAEKEEFIYNMYKAKLQYEFATADMVGDVESIQDLLGTMELGHANATSFIITPEGEIVTSDNKPLSEGFLRYMFKYSLIHDAPIAEHTGWGAQGVVIKVKTTTGEWKVGIKYEVKTSNETVIVFLVGVMILIALNVVVLLFFSKSLSEDITLVTNKLNEIGEGTDILLGNKLSVTSCDEIGDLVMAFNNIQQREKEYVKTIEKNQNMLMERERLASLGQLIGGISHNLKTPIMSMAGGLEAIKDLANEFDESLDDGKVTKDDFREICKEMDVWVEKMKSYTTYMSDVITAVKGQAVHLSESSEYNFTLDELVKRVDILMRQEIVKNDCIMNKEFKADMNIQIKGEVNNLVQILNNLITNAIDSFEGKRGTIDFSILKSGKYIEFIIKDYGKGIPKEIQEKVMKEMVTTKGKKGTGLGLYMSTATIKGKFGGNMWFESKEGIGTSFHISVPHLQISYREGIDDEKKKDW